MHRAPAGARLDFKLKMPETNHVALVLQQNEWRSYRGPRRTFVCEREITGAGTTQSIIFEPKDFTSPDGPLTSWDHIDQLGICAHYNPRGASTEQVPLWKGPAMTLVRLEWV